MWRRPRLTWERRPRYLVRVTDGDTGKDIHVPGFGGPIEYGARSTLILTLGPDAPEHREVVVEFIPEDDAPRRPDLA